LDNHQVNLAPNSVGNFKHLILNRRISLINDEAALTNKKRAFNPLERF
jgi:hypothetical protein